jgi:hypothetical protein
MKPDEQRGSDGPILLKKSGIWTNVDGSGA